MIKKNDDNSFSSQNILKTILKEFERGGIFRVISTFHAEVPVL